MNDVLERIDAYLAAVLHPIHGVTLDKEDFIEVLRLAKLGAAADEAVKEGLIIQVSTMNGTALCCVGNKVNPVDGSCLFYENCSLYDFCTLREEAITCQTSD